MNRLSLCALLVCGAAHADPVIFESSAIQTSLVELYTSEGCSSCPPAEAWLSRCKAAPRLWKDFVPVAFHVDYWDRLGWPDPWASSQFSERQKAYAAAAGSGSVYTPEFVVNGKEWHSWTGRKTFPTAPNRKAGVLVVGSDDVRRWKASFAPSVGGSSRYEINAALLGSEISSEVKAGENQGRHLQHDFAALALVKQPLAAGPDGYCGEFILESKATPACGRLAIAVWITRADALEPLQAVGGWLLETGNANHQASAGAE